MSNVDSITNEALKEVHSLLIQAMAQKLKSGEEVKASYLDTVRKFLLDNGETRVGNPQEYVDQLEEVWGVPDDYVIPDPMRAYDNVESESTDSNQPGGEDDGIDPTAIPDCMRAYDDVVGGGDVGGSPRGNSEYGFQGPQ